MQIAFINEHEYFLNNYYSEANGRLHLFINNENNYNLSDIETDVLEGNGKISIIDDTLGKEISSFYEYNILKQCEKRYDENPQIYLIIETKNLTSTVVGMQNNIEGIEREIFDLNNRITTLSSSISDLNSMINPILQDVNDLKNNAIKTVTLEDDLSNLSELVDDLSNNLTISNTNIDSIASETTILRAQVDDLVAAQADAIQHPEENI